MLLIFLFGIFSFSDWEYKLGEVCGVDRFVEIHDSIPSKYSSTMYKINRRGSQIQARIRGKIVKANLSTLKSVMDKDKDCVRSELVVAPSDWGNLLSDTFALSSDITSPDTGKSVFVQYFFILAALKSGVCITSDSSDACLRVESHIFPQNMFPGPSIGGNRPALVNSIFCISLLNDDECILVSPWDFVHRGRSSKAPVQDDF